MNLRRKLALWAQTEHRVLYIYLLYGATANCTSGTCVCPAPSTISTSYTPRSFAVVLSRTKISKKFENSCRVTVNGILGSRVKGLLFLVQSNCWYPPDALVSRTSFSGGSRTMTRGEILSSVASPVCNTKANYTCIATSCTGIQWTPACTLLGWQINLAQNIASSLLVVDNISV